MQVSDSSSRILAGLLEARTGQQLTMSRRWRIETALAVAAARARHRHARRADHHPRHGHASRRSPSQVVEALLNNETYFFRDRTPFDLLATARAARAGQAPRVDASASASGRPAARPARKPIRWRCCSPRTRRAGQGWTIDILGTDVSRRRRSTARATGIYSQFEVQRGLGINQMIRWFEEIDDGWRAVEALRRTVRFQVHNLLEPPPHPGQFDIVLCRNVLLYLNAEKRGAGVRPAGVGDGARRLADARRRRDRDRPDRAASPPIPRRAASIVRRGERSRRERREPRVASRGLTARPRLVRHARPWTCIDRPSPNFDERDAAGVDDRPPLYRNARLPRARSTG